LLWTPFAKDERDGASARVKLNDIPSSFSIFCQMFGRASLLYCYWSFLLMVHRGIELDHRIVIDLYYWSLSEWRINKAADFLKI
jgi:hypothetical protein